VKKLDTKSATVFTKLLKAESYPHFEARSMLLCEKGTRKTTAARTTHGGEKTRQKICSCVHTKLLKEKGYAHFEARSVLLGEKGTGKTTVTRTTHGGEKTRQTICSCVYKSTERRKLRPL
jgi:transcriptional regulator with AAA-type ATPase domain